MAKVRDLEIGMFIRGQTGAREPWQVDGIGKAMVRLINKAGTVKTLPYPADPDIEVEVIYEVTDEYAKQLIEQTLEGTEI